MFSQGEGRPTCQTWWWNSAGLARVWNHKFELIVRHFDVTLIMKNGIIFNKWVRRELLFFQRNSQESTWIYFSMISLVDSALRVNTHTSHTNCVVYRIWFYNMRLFASGTFSRWWFINLYWNAHACMFMRIRDPFVRQCQGAFFWTCVTPLAI